MQTNNGCFFTDYTVEVLLVIYANPGIRTMALHRKLASQWSTTKLSGELGYLHRNNALSRLRMGWRLEGAGEQILKDERDRARMQWRSYCEDNPVHPREGVLV